MEKDIITFGFEIPGYSNFEKNITSNVSLMDADIVVICPEIIKPSSHSWVSFSSGGGGCYDVSASTNFINKLQHLKKELTDMLKLGKTIFILLSEKNTFLIALSTSHPRKGQTTYNTTSSSNYDFLPISIGKLTSASGDKIIFTGNSIFANFNKEYNKNLVYKAYVENSENCNIVYTGKDTNKILGSIQKVGNGHLITLPMIEFNKDFTKYDEEKDKYFWTKEGVSFGKNFIQNLLEIDKNLTSNSNKTPIPDWASLDEFVTSKAKSIEKSIETNNKKILELKESNIKYNDLLLEENKIKDLLFESGKPLEDAVTNALNILGYEAQNYEDGVLELDQVIVSPEKHRFIGECEGKDTKDINITKFRQLLESLNADFARDEVQEKAFGILFGNPQRLSEPNSRTLDFTEKCKIGAEREKIALVKTSDLFFVIKYLKENDNDNYKKKCRDAIYKGLGKIVTFPPIPKTKSRQT
ncbi:hypothetical protein SAMN05421841_3996 [Chryseobacterium wanjuense]|uniref:Uncharacterized protein n=1 Tax=Chryseobacterium wanjuense TaxID=356305 RepID=A0A1I0S330_9FLAO|nr:hypothetical protein [Chryseobacterium wanjuense]SEW49061.1 hypothetical protein SAMN05421841_3996 [Chryseobacterium wanjuense]